MIESEDLSIPVDKGIMKDGTIKGGSIRREGQLLSELSIMKDLLPTSVYIRVISVGLAIEDVNDQKNPCNGVFPNKRSPCR